MGATPELDHIAIARKYIGIRETQGANRSPQIDKWCNDLSGKWLLGQPWCGIFAAAVLKEAGLANRIPKDFFRASAWSEAGTKLDKPAYGCIVTFTREGGGHVGFVVGKTASGNLKVLGGNQGDSVCINDFSPSRVTAYRWVSTGSVPNEHRYDLPVLPAGKISVNEA